MLARVLGALEGIGLIGLATGSLLAPVIVAVVGIEPALVVVGVLLPLGVLLGWSGLREIDRTGLVPTRALDLLRAGALFAPLAPPQLEIIARRSRWLTLEPGEAVIREGDPGDAYYVLESGELSISQVGRHLRDITDRGEGLGEIALLRDIARTATVTAVRPSVLLMLGRADFLEAMTGIPRCTTRRVGSRPNACRWRSPARSLAIPAAGQGCDLRGPVPQQPPSQPAPSVFQRDDCGVETSPSLGDPRASRGIPRIAGVRVGDPRPV